MTKYKLAQLVEIKYGKDHKKLGKGSVPVYGTGGIMRYVNDFIYEGESVLIPRKGSLNNLFYVHGKFWTVDTIFWTKINSKIVLPRYLYYYLLKIDLTSYNVGSAVPSLTISLLNELVLDIPPISVQKDVVKKLIAIENKIKLNEQINDNLLELTQSVYQELNSNRTTDGTLSNICQLVTKKIDSAELNNNNFWSISNLLSNKRGATQAKEMPKSAKCTEVYRFDTLFGNIRPYFKKVYLASRNGGCSPDVLAFRAISQNLQAYLFSIIASDKFINQAVAGSKGTKMPRGDKEQMMETPIYTPTEQELSAFNKAVIPSLVAIQENTTENEYLTLIKQQLLLKYF